MVRVNGGRVLTVTALRTQREDRAAPRLQVADRIHFNGMQMRRDIGHRAIKARPPGRRSAQ